MNVPDAGTRNQVPGISKRDVYPKKQYTSCVLDQLIKLNKVEITLLGWGLMSIPSLCPSVLPWKVIHESRCLRRSSHGTSSIQMIGVLLSLIVVAIANNMAFGRQDQECI